MCFFNGKPTFSFEQITPEARALHLIDIIIRKALTVWDKMERRAKFNCIISFLII